MFIIYHIEIYVYGDKQIYTYEGYVYKDIYMKFQPCLYKTKKYR